MKGLRKGLKAPAAVIACVMSLPVMAPVADELMVYAEDIAADTASGTYENLSWCIEDEVLTISGEGEMAPDPELNSNSLEAGSYPWAEYDYTSIVIEEGVTSISLNAFYKSPAISVSLPESLVSIGSRSFSKSSIESLTLPSGVRALDFCSFDGCKSLSSITIEAQLTEIPSACFSGTAIETIELPDTLQIIGWSAFSYCKNLKSIKLPQSVTTIESSAFTQCKNLESLELHEGITTLGERLIMETKITELHIPESVTECDAFAADCDTLTTLTLPEHILATEIPDNFFLGCEALDVASFIHDGITRIGENAFAHTNLTSITIPETVTSIGNFAFAYTDIASIVIPESVTSIGSSVFQMCSSLEYAEIKGKITSIPFQCFTGCSSLKTCVLPDTVKVIGLYAFQSCSFTDIDLPDSLTEIQSNAFDTAVTMNSVVLPASVTMIQNNSFNNVHSLTLGANTKINGDSGLNEFKCLDEIYVHPDNPYYEAEDGILYSKGRTSVLSFAATHTFENDTFTVPDNVSCITQPIRCSNIKAYAVSDTHPVYSTVDGFLTDKSGTKLISCPYGIDSNTITVPDGITAIGEFAFYDTLYPHIILPDTVTEIGNYAFTYNVKKINIPASVSYIGKKAFSGCWIYCMRIESMSGYAESNAMPLNAKTIVLPEGSQFDITNAVSDNTKIVYEAADGGEVTASGTHGDFTWEIRNRTLTIYGSGEMDSCAAEEYPWYDLDYYQLKFEGENISVPENAFSGSYTLCNLYLDNVVSIGASAFSGCSSLSSVTGDENISLVGKGAFDDTAWLEETFYHYSEEAEGLAVIGTVAIKADADAETVRIPQYTTYIAEDAFGSCKNIRTLYIPGSDVSYPDNAFSLCSGIERLCWSDTGEAITLSQLQAIASECRTISITDSTGETVTAKAVFRSDILLNLINTMTNTPYVQNLTSEYCRSIISETGINSSMSDEELIRIMFDYLLDTTYYSFTYLESPSGACSGENTLWDMNKLYSHLPEGLAIMKSGVCSSYSGVFAEYASVLAEDGISTTISASENYGAGHQWNVIGLDTGTENERWYYLDASNGQYLIGYEANILRENPAMFSYDPDIPLNEDGTYTVTLHDGTAVNIQAKNAAREYGRGDTDLDGDIDLEDAALILSIYAMKAVGITPELSADSIAASDINEDGATNLDDAAAVLSYYAQKAAGLEPSWDEIIKA